ncbi:hypothetical protein CDL15_Pgr012493 [Punica granatum]|uniref:Uncharacterized protein n=1 Tax=Punica granatum TaxID=22663 RepID=A0A218WXW0_PUNGR|nr:hypothetical protein CDL15_Pgr012493 [Punica granatum]
MAPKQSTYADFKSTYPPKGTLPGSDKTWSGTASNADHEDRGIRVQHSCRATSVTCTPGQILFFFLDDRGNHL